MPTRLRTCLLAAALGLSLGAGCGGGGASGNHTVRLVNAGRSAGATSCLPRQFAFLSVERVAPHFAYSTNMMVAKGQTVDVAFDLPGDGTFLLRVGAKITVQGEVSPMELTWNAVPMTLGGTTVVHLETGDEAGTAGAGYRAHSTADGLSPSFCDITCTN